MILNSENFFFSKQRNSAYVSFYINLPRNSKNRLFTLVCSKNIVNKNVWQCVIKIKNAIYNYTGHRARFEIARWDQKKVLEEINNIIETNHVFRRALVGDIFND